MLRLVFTRFLAACLATAALAGTVRAAVLSPPDLATPAAHRFVSPIVPAQGASGSADPSGVVRDGAHCYLIAK